MATAEQGRYDDYPTAPRAESFRPAAGSTFTPPPSTFGRRGTGPRWGPPPQLPGAASARSALPASGYAARAAARAAASQATAQLSSGYGDTGPGTMPAAQRRAKTPAAQSPAAATFPAPSRRAATPPSRMGNTYPARPVTVAGAGQRPLSPLSRSPAPLTAASAAATPTTSRPRATAGPQPVRRSPPPLRGPTGTRAAPSLGADGRTARRLEGPAPPANRAHAAPSTRPSHPQAPLQQPGEVPSLSQLRGGDWLSSYERVSAALLQELEGLLGGQAATTPARAGVRPLQLLPRTPAPAPGQRPPAPGSGPGLGPLAAGLGSGSLGAGPGLQAPSSPSPQPQLASAGARGLGHGASPAAVTHRAQQVPLSAGLSGAQASPLPAHTGAGNAAAAAAPEGPSAAVASDAAAGAGPAASLSLSPAQGVPPAGMLGELWNVLQASNANTARLMADLTSARREAEEANERAAAADELMRTFQQQLVSRTQQVATWQAAMADVEERESSAQQQLAEARERCGQLEDRARQAERVAATAQLRLERLIEERQSHAHAHAQALGLAPVGEEQVTLQLSHMRADLAAAESRATRAELELAVARNKALIAQQELAAEEARAQRAAAAASAAHNEVMRSRAALEALGREHDRLHGQLAELRSRLADKDEQLHRSAQALLRTSAGLQSMLQRPPVAAAAAAGTAAAAPAAANPAAVARPSVDAVARIAPVIALAAAAGGAGSREVHEDGVSAGSADGGAVKTAGLEAKVTSLAAHRKALAAAQARRSAASADSGDSHSSNSGCGSSNSSSASVTAAIAALRRLGGASPPVLPPAPQVPGGHRRHTLLLLAPGEMPLEATASLRYGQSGAFRRQSLSQDGADAEPTASGPGLGPLGGGAAGGGGVGLPEPSSPQGPSHAAAGAEEAEALASPLSRFNPGRMLTTHDGVLRDRPGGPREDDAAASDAEVARQRLLRGRFTATTEPGAAVRSTRPMLQTLLLGSASTGGGSAGGSPRRNTLAGAILPEEMLPLSRAPSSARRRLSYRPNSESIGNCAAAPQIQFSAQSYGATEDSTSGSGVGAGAGAAGKGSGSPGTRPSSPSLGGTAATVAGMRAAASAAAAAVAEAVTPGEGLHGGPPPRQAWAEDAALLPAGQGTWDAITATAGSAPQQPQREGQEQQHAQGQVQGSRQGPHQRRASDASVSLADLRRQMAVTAAAAREAPPVRADGEGPRRQVPRGSSGEGRWAPSGDQERRPTAGSETTGQERSHVHVACEGRPQLPRSASTGARDGAGRGVSPAGPAASQRQPDPVVDPVVDPMEDPHSSASWHSRSHSLSKGPRHGDGDIHEGPPWGRGPARDRVGPPGGSGSGTEADGSGTSGGRTGDSDGSGSGAGSGGGPDAEEGLDGLAPLRRHLALTPRSRMLSPSQLDSYRVSASLTSSLSIPPGVANPPALSAALCRDRGAAANVTGADQTPAAWPPGALEAPGLGPLTLRAATSGPVPTCEQTGCSRGLSVDQQCCRGRAVPEAGWTLPPTPQRRAQQPRRRRRRPWWRWLLPLPGRSRTTAEDPGTGSAAWLSTSASPRSGDVRLVQGSATSSSAAAAGLGAAGAGHAGASAAESSDAPRVHGPAPQAPTRHAGSPRRATSGGSGGEWLGRDAERGGGSGSGGGLAGALLYLGGWAGGVALGVALVLGLAAVAEGALGPGRREVIGERDPPDVERGLAQLRRLQCGCGPRDGGGSRERERGRASAQGGAR